MPSQPPEMPMQPPGMPTPPPPMRPMRKPPITDLYLKIGVVFLGLSVAVGLFAYHAIMFIPSPTSGPLPPPSYQQYATTIRILGIISFAFMDAAVGFSVILAMFVGLSREAIPDVTRRGAWLFAVVIPTVWIILSATLYSAFLSFLVYL